MPRSTPASWSLYATDGQRKYLTADERSRFLHTARQVGRTRPEVQTLCEVMVFTGCRISEALAVTSNAILLAEGVVTFRTLKQRNVYTFRHVPIPDELVVLLDQVHVLQEARAYCAPKRLWPWHRVTAYRLIKDIMQEANIFGACACPRGLRHGFGVHAITHDIPETLVQRWLGHADLATTKIYLNVVRHEERAFAGRMW